MRFLLAPTEDFIKQERAIIGADVSAGSSVAITLENTDGLTANDYVAIGYEGSELCELEQIATVDSDTQITVTTLKFNHKKGDPVTMYRFNKRKFYGSLTETGSYTELTGDGSPADIQVDDPQGTRLEYSGTTYLFFKATYYNSTTLDETVEDDATAVEADESKRYATVFAIRKHAGLAGNTFYSDVRIETKRKQAENEIDSAIFSRYDLPLSEVPALLGQICELLAAGYIDFEEFGKDGEGVKWLGQARAILKQIVEGKRRLIGTDGSELAVKAKVGVLNGYPDDSIDTGSGEDVKFKIDDTF